MRSTHQNYYGYSGDNLRSRGRFLYPIQQITLNERALVALCLGLILLVCFIYGFCLIYCYKSDDCCVFKG
ncbi:MAG: hypothetical protein HFP77_03830 [Methylococcales symbiont of Iophon sp. n. MRB-2018]|nr:MAG: hypothetical protein HFP77_03830 [Methylococcales symbiont of Iophon sp. n. MRB-2018]